MKRKEYPTEPILIVEDSRFNQMLLQSLCEEMGVNSHIADNGMDALEKTASQDYSVYIVDLMMPVMDGKSFIRKIKETRPEATIIVQTALNSSEVIIEIMKLGVFDYIIKPIDKDQFNGAVTKALEYRRLKENEIRAQKIFQAEILKVRELQAKLLPDLKMLRGYDSAFSILPVENLSGDFLDGIMIDENTYQIVLCDVSGHGIASSYIGMEIRSLFRALSLEKLPPSRLLEKVNSRIINDHSSDYYIATVVVCQINMKSGKILISSGGHPPAFLSPHDVTGCREIKPGGPLIGIIEGKAFQDIELEMKSGDCLLLYTDGVTESISPGGELYGGERLK